MPDFLCMAHAFKFDKKSARGEVPGWRDADDAARALQDAACSGTDPPLPVPLPHSKAIIHGRKGGCGLPNFPRNPKTQRQTNFWAPSPLHMFPTSAKQCLQFDIGNMISRPRRVQLEGARLEFPASIFRLI